MNDTPKTDAGQGFGIAGLVVGIITIMIAFIPCIGLFALFPGIIALTFSIIALVQANAKNGARELIIAALVISILGTSIAAVWGLFFAAAANQGLHWKNKIEKQMNDSNDEPARNLEDSFEDIGSELENALNGLHLQDTTYIDSDKILSSDDFNKLLNDYELTINKFIKFNKKQKKKNDLTSFAELGHLSINALEMAKKLGEAVPNMSPEQKKKFHDLSEKYNISISEFEDK